MTEKLTQAEWDDLWEVVTKADINSTPLEPGERTVKMHAEAANIPIDRARDRLNRRVAKGLMTSRDILIRGKKAIAYRPIPGLIIED